MAKAKSRHISAASSVSPASSSSSWNYAALAQAVIDSAQRNAGGAPSKLPPGLYLVATPIGHRGDITLRALVTLMQVDAVLAEDTRVTGSLLRAYGIRAPLLACHDHNEAARAPEFTARMQAGESFALVSDAGMPLVSDPGFRLVRAAAEAGIQVTVCPGASSVLSALALSGLPPEPFLFAGFLPAKSKARQDVLRGFRDMRATLLFLESPQRLAASLADMAAVFGPRPAAIARELTKLHEECRRAPLPELAAHYAAHPPRGEIVIAVGPPEEKPQAAVDLDAMLRDALKSNSLRDAAALVAAATGLPRDQVYKRALALRDEA